MLDGFGLEEGGVLDGVGVGGGGGGGGVLVGGGGGGLVVVIEVRLHLRTFALSRKQWYPGAIMGERGRLHERVDEATGEGG